MLSDQEAFTLTYTVSPSFWTEEYSVKLALEDGRLTLKTRNAPGVQRTHGEERKVREGRKQVLPQEEAVRILNLLRRVRLATLVQEDPWVTDSSFYRLSLKHGGVDLDLHWYHELPKGWRGLQPLQGMLEHYATIYGHASKGQTR